MGRRKLYAWIRKLGLDSTQCAGSYAEGQALQRGVLLKHRRSSAVGSSPCGRERFRRRRSAAEEVVGPKMASAMSTLPSSFVSAAC